MRIDILCSGSKGNCTLIRAGNTAIMLDCGSGTRKYILDAMKEVEFDKKDLDGILITHTHSDHIGQLRHFVKAPIYSYCQLDVRDLKKRPVAFNHHCIHPLEPFEIKDLRIIPVALSHDAGPTTGFVIEDKTDQSYTKPLEAPKKEVKPQNREPAALLAAAGQPPLSRACSVQTSSWDDFDTHQDLLVNDDLLVNEDLVEKGQLQKKKHPAKETDHLSGETSLERVILASDQKPASISASSAGQNPSGSQRLSDERVLWQPAELPAGYEEWEQWNELLLPGAGFAESLSGRNTRPDASSSIFPGADSNGMTGPSRQANETELPCCASKERLVYITDTGYLNTDLFPLIKGARYYVMESNHDVRMLMNTNRSWWLKQRIVSATGHLSNEQCAEALCQLVDDNTAEVVLAHLSQEANTADLALSAFHSVFEHFQVSTKGFSLATASQDQILSLGHLNQPGMLPLIPETEEEN